jgi:2-(1,2-epoxy-1,2-dihydrophenyl)acetyl-CoA isomerase
LSVKQAEGPRVRASAHPWGTWVELCAPHVRNALDPPAVTALLDIFTRDEPGAVLLTARGPAFCAGGDLSVLSGAAVAGDLTEVLVTPAAAFADLVEAVVACPRPVVAVLDGPAVGGGASLALACDLRLATARAQLVLAWARWGLPPDGGATALLSAAVGAQTARALLADGAEIGTESPLAPRLFSRVLAADEDAEASAVETATALAATPGAVAAKAITAGPRLASLRAGRGAELAAVAAAARDPSVVARLANVYKMEK